MNTTLVPSSSSSLANTLNRVVGVWVVNVYPLLITFGVLSHLINIGVLRARHLRHSSCTFYFLFSSLASVVYLNGSPLSLYLTYRWGVSTSGSPFGCRWTTFMIFSSALFVTVMFVSASIDRYLSSSSSARLRALSRVTTAKGSIAVLLLVVLFYSCPFILIYEWNYSTNRCVQHTSTLIFVYLSSRIVLFYLLGPSIMAFFGFATIANIRTRVGRIGAAMEMNSSRQRTQRRTEGQLTRMLILQVGLYLIFSFPSAITYTLTTFVPSTNNPTVNAWRIVTLIWQHLSYISSTFLYILSAKVYRDEFLKLIRLKRFFGGRTTDATRGTTLHLQHTIQ